MGRLLQEEELGQRGAVRVLRYEFTFEDFAAGAGTHTFDLPQLEAGTILRAWHVNVQVVFNSGSSDSLEIGDSVDPNRFGTANNQQSLSNAAPGAGTDPAPHQLAALVVPRLTVVTAGTAPTTGKTHVTLTYESCNI